jgi:hypothetical protein
VLLFLPLTREIKDDGATEEVLEEATKVAARIQSNELDNCGAGLVSEREMRGLNWMFFSCR